MQYRFEILFVVGNPGKISKRISKLSILETKNCRNLKFGEVLLVFILEKNVEKSFLT